ncbi:hypothetical protein ANO14919_055720 [Xylariales sp. No.14919]|nr:hypothetical protein ANO14919_055720 [Xylariales sp. No.14919]
MVLSYDIAPFRFESRDISLSDWISLLTLTLAPLLAHVVAGTPRPIILSRTEPKWHDMICHYNPTSIIWRYAAITDRRIRARVWDEGSLATTNALFWTSHGWDGTEEMAASALRSCTRLPRRTRLKLLSWETAKTVIITLQGIQVTTIGLSNLSGPNDLTIGFAIDSVFIPLAALGLSRLLAAFWLTDDYDFTRVEDAATTKEFSGLSRMSMDSLLEPREVGEVGTNSFNPTHLWSSRLFRLFYLLLLLGSVPVFALYVSPGRQTITSLIYIIFYLILLSSSLVLLSFYFIHGPTTTTIIPCISSAWYKVYSLAIFTMMLTVLIVSGIETRKTPCGKYTAWPSPYGDTLLCETKDSSLVYVGDVSQNLVFGLASRYPNHTIGTITDHGVFWVRNFTGSCMGKWTDGIQRHASAVTNIWKQD